jgi:hypothetical protein
MAVLRTGNGLVFVVGGGSRYISIMAEDRGGEDKVNLALEGQEAVSLGEFLKGLTADEVQELAGLLIQEGGR